MSTRQVSQYELESAAFHAMDSGFDVEVAEDLGITTPENAARQIESGKQVGELLTATAVTVENDGWKPGDDYKNGFDTQSWANQSEAQKEINRRGIEQARQAIADNQANKDQ